MGFASSLSLFSPPNAFSSTLTHRHRFNSAHITESPKAPKFKLSASSEPQRPNTQKNFWRQFAVEKAVGFVVGSAVIVGCFAAKKRFSAIPSPTTQPFANSESLGDERDEEVLYERLLQREPGNVKALKAVFHAKMAKGKTKEALRFVEKLVVLEPKEMEWRLLRALCCEMVGDLSSAKRFFKEILKERPLLLRALHGLASVMHKNNEGPAIFVMLDKALKIARREQRVIEERNIRILIAQMHVIRGDLEESLNEFQNLVKEDHRDFRPYLCLGIIYSLLDKKTEAAEQFEMYKALAPEEFPQRGFLDDVMMSAKTISREQLQQEFQDEFSARK